MDEGPGGTPRGGRDVPAGTIRPRTGDRPSQVFDPSRKTRRGGGAGRVEVMALRKNAPLARSWLSLAFVAYQRQAPNVNNAL